ncbi:XtrA/YqaO family protein [Bacillus swezeyi]|uniref:Uncharacterized protein n=1 Tax=Bacillus swezeyi TaxID=1925020 RepID=A0A5M8RSQ8_9BACI|nr:XtrA/YqaO family protein [Bacillus swezeyi]KAA6450989.1 hypothetical protein DX927_09165 [Bacillus swezeyi]
MKPKTITINDDFTFTGTLEPGELRVIVLDGNNGTAHTLDAPNHGQTIIQTVDGSFTRVDHKIGYQFKKTKK